MKTTSQLLPTTSGYSIPDKQPRSQAKTLALAAASLCLGGLLLCGSSTSAPAYINRISRSPPAVDVCDSSRFLTYDQLNNCLHRTPYNETEKLELVEYYRRVLPLYVFESVSKEDRTFGPYTIPAVDLQEELNKIEQTEYANDADMQHAFFSLLNRLNDAHTSHGKPAEYYGYYALQPISIMSIERDGQQVIQILDIDSAEVETYRALHPRAHADFDVAGWEVQSIDGVPAIDALRTFAEDIGSLKDDGGRFNLAVSGYKTGRGWFVFRPMIVLPVPASRTVVYELQHPATGVRKTVSYDWTALNVRSNIEDQSKQGKKFATLFDKLKAHFIQHELFDEPDAIEYIPSVDSNAAVLKINTFDGNDPTFYDDFATNVTSALAQFTESKKEKLILDLTGNNGGNICLGYATLRYLFPGLDEDGPHEGRGPHLDAVYRVRRTNLSVIMADQSAQAEASDPNVAMFLSPTQFYSTKSRRQFLDATWMTQGETTVLGEMSQGVYRSCANMYAKFPAPGVNFKIAPDNLVVMSQGYCGSTCAVFTSYIQAHGLASTVALGGYLDTPQQAFGFPGGQVGRVSDYLTLGNLMLAVPDLADKVSPWLPQLPTSGRYVDTSYTHMSISPWNNGGVDVLPLEYSFVPADHSILYPGNPTNYDAIYAAVLQAAASS
ncbi:hypothetical protein ACHHYP_15860 [Achlya hypogyna]|uniref:Tail specific protease domain-containing protein n=1 Tax=Achlya hypogyna TaxID=1202772 RepID=A0A1V9YA07_ACHHY|nr:hypothetical protein ACHHYP_15860 [Achlya hypogyna]